jgi:hypothetical protein
MVAQVLVRRFSSIGVQSGWAFAAAIVLISVAGLGAHEAAT